MRHTVKEECGRRCDHQNDGKGLFYNPGTTTILKKISKFL
ncbi:hypothetical protein TNIN_359581, partial [Trichonephila inaurata madagascariensis]